MSQMLASNSPWCVGGHSQVHYSFFFFFNNLPAYSLAYDIRNTFRPHSTAPSSLLSAAWFAPSRIVVRPCSPFPSQIPDTPSAHITSLPAHKRAVTSRAPTPSTPPYPPLYPPTHSPPLPH